MGRVYAAISLTSNSMNANQRVVTEGRSVPGAGGGGRRGRAPLEPLVFSPS